MKNLLNLWQGLTMARRAVLVAATLGMFLAILGLARMGGAERQGLLYSGLDPRAAGEVIAALDQSGVGYEVRGDSIYVPASARDGLRMQLAGQGLPATGGAGYELLDGLSGFGTTSQMFDAAYWRAKEGELARTVLAMPQVRAARVHIAQTAGDGFLRDRRMTASVTVTMAGGALGQEQADALRHLVASATGGTQPADVAVIDSQAGLIPVADGTATLVGETRAAEIKRNVERLLAARVGPGKAVVEVSLDLVREREAITERTFDPQARVAISSETEQRSESATGAQSGVTVASNLPEGDGAAGSSGQSQATENRERVNYEVSQIQREVMREPGAIRRLTVAVLVDGEQVAGQDGATVWQPRGEGELADLRDLVASAAGIDDGRGDVLTIKSLQFQPVAADGVLAEAGMFSGLGPLDVMSAIKVAVLGLVALALALFVIRPLLVARSASAGLPAPGQAIALPGPDSPGSAFTSEAFTGEISDGFDLPGLPAVSHDAANPGADGDPVARLRRLMGERQAESIEILRNWMEREEERS